MKKVLLGLALAAGISANSFAQSGSSENKGGFSIGIEAGLPVGDAADFYSAVLGASLKYEHPVAESTFITGSAGYNAFLTKSRYKDLGFESTSGAIPVKGGIKQMLGSGFFGEAQLGAAFSTSSGGGTAFIYAPGLGYNFSPSVDAGVRYEAWSNNGTTSQVGLRIGFKF
ncbi:hypothetical protein [uncultured Mucilaginibacter sp.]|uniref:hypothetical protein n=1 Tax=uncultured Mucilaginibacter sp. TaxID=797541 RepID=UPI0025F9697D|nr:hypothetical protein [uncultured Mucilaginibacter sp.]